MAKSRGAGGRNMATVERTVLAPSIRRAIDRSVASGDIVMVRRSSLPAGVKEVTGIFGTSIGMLASRKAFGNMINAPGFRHWVVGLNGPREVKPIRGGPAGQRVDLNPGEWFVTLSPPNTYAGTRRPWYSLDYRE